MRARILFSTLLLVGCASNPCPLGEAPVFGGYFPIDSSLESAIGVSEACQGNRHVILLIDPQREGAPAEDAVQVPPLHRNEAVHFSGCTDGTANPPPILGLAPIHGGSARIAWIVDVRSRKFVETSGVSCQSLP